MRIGILRPIPQFSFSMDVYADALIDGLKTVRPDWEIIELAPTVSKVDKSPVLTGINKYYERYWHYPHRLKRQDIDIFHIIDHSDGHLLYWLNKLPQPKIITCHDLINLIHPETFKGRSIFPRVSMTSWNFAVKGMRYADRIIAVSSNTAKDITNYLHIPEQSIATVPNAVSSQFSPIPQAEIDSYRQQRNITNREFCLLNVGSNNSRKNISLILEAIAILKSRNLPIRFWKTGADFNLEQKSFIAANDLTGCVTYLGKPVLEELIKIYNAADVLVSPSFYEGFGLTVLEAMACGTPVITSNVTSLPEVAGDAAILINPTEVEEIVTAILRLQAEPQTRQTLIDRGLSRVKQFTWEETASRVAEIYNQTLQTA